MPEKTIEDIAEAFEFFDEWEDRYAFLIELGKKLPPFREEWRRDEYRVRGCTSKVWLVIEKQQDGKSHISADSDADIVRGLIYLLLLVYQDKTPEEIRAYDIEATFATLGLDKHLFPSRRNGFFAMVERVRAIAG